MVNNWRRRSSDLRRSIPLAAMLLLGLAQATPAHEVPARVTVLAFVKPSAHRLQVIVRVPIEAIRDVNLPLMGTGFLDIARAEPLLRDAARIWIATSLEFFEGDRPLNESEVVATQVSLPSDRSFESFDSARAHLSDAPLPPGTALPWQQAMLDVELAYPIDSDRADFSVRPALAHLGIKTTTVLRFLPVGGDERAYRYDGNPGLVRLDPGALHAVMQFVRLGFEHILSGLDHLLFVLCLVIPFRRIRPLVAIVTSFTVAHSITLVAATRGWVPTALWFPPLIETLIALSIVYMALENIVAPRLERRWMVAFAFGLVHGVGFSFALQESVQFAGRHLFTSLVSFNVGVEIGQLLVIAVAVPVLGWCFRRLVSERMGTVVLSALVAHTAWHWMTDRGSTLLAYDFRAPVWNAALAISLMRGVMALLILGGVAWGLAAGIGRWLRPTLGATLLTPDAQARPPVHLSSLTDS